MKIDRSRLRKGTSEVPSECQALIETLRQCSRSELYLELAKINNWTFGKCELYHWIEVLDVFDSILKEASNTLPDNKWALYCDTHYDAKGKKLLLWTLHFTTLLIEHSFSRHLYNSTEHLLSLMCSSNMEVVLSVLNLLYMFSKRSNFITRLGTDKKQSLISRLHYLAEGWGGKENGFGLADCCIKNKSIPHSATTLHFEFHKDHVDDKNGNDSKDTKSKNSSYIHVENVDKLYKTPAEIMKGLTALYFIPPEKEMWLFTHVRLAHQFANYNSRLLCVQVRLQALSVLVYSNAVQDSAHTLLYNGLLEELVELVELDDPAMVDIRSAALRSLTSIIHLDRNPHFPKKPGSRLNNIIDVTGASHYHGFLPTLVRNCITSLTKQIPKKDKEEHTKPVEKKKGGKAKNKTVDNPEDSGQKFPLPLATALFSFLYHLASYEAGGEALVSCGMMESLLQVINWHGVELEHITFVTRAVRVIDLITNMDMQTFHTYGGLQSFMTRLNVEIKLCQGEQSYEFVPVDDDMDRAGQSDFEDEGSNYECHCNAENIGKTCLPQRAALLKSMLNFLKKALQDTVFSDSVRHVMEGILPSVLKHIIANAEYYGPSLFLLATDLITVYVFQEPTLLSTLQDYGLTDIILHALLVKEIPATREVLASLPNVFSALCLNARGLDSFMSYRPFDQLFRVLISQNFLPAMRRRRSSDPIGDTASNLGNAMDELMRHQPSLKIDAIRAMIQLLKDLCHLGFDPKYVCWRPPSKAEQTAVLMRPQLTNEGSSDEEDDEEEEASTSSHNVQADTQETSTREASEKTPIALIDYILNTMKFIDAILSNNSTDDHCREFVHQGGLDPLLRVLGLPNVPVDCPVTIPAQAVASVCKSILNLAHESKVLSQGLIQLNEVLVRLKPLYSHVDTCVGSKLLHELANTPRLESAFNNAHATPLLHAMTATHGYVLMFVHVCRTGQNEIRTLSLQHWGSPEGLIALKGLSELYTALVWESTLLLALCSDDAIPADSDFGREDMEKLNVPVFDRPESNYSSTAMDASNVASALEGLSTNGGQVSMDVDTQLTTNKPTSQQLKYIKPLLGASSRLGRALAELFGLLVKLCVGTPVRQRRGQNIVTSPPFPSPYARSICTSLNYLLANGLNFDRLPPSPIPKFKLTFLICSVGFTSPMLFDEKRYPYHLMLQKFVTHGAQSTFFNTFRWALSAGNTIKLSEGLECPNLPEGTGEFLDAWLLLLEKMVNPKAILETPHGMANKTTASSDPATKKYYAFNPLHYLIQIHKLAFEAVMLLWGKKPLPIYGTRMSESILSILRHILRGEKIIKERFTKNEDKANSISVGGNAETFVNREYLQQLMDMGFSREHAWEALIHSITVEQATEYLLSSASNALRPGNSGMEVDISEDDQFIQAVALSLGEPGPSTGRRRQSHDDQLVLSEELINNFTESALHVCLELLEAIPETVYKICELLGTIMKRNGATFRDDLLDKLVNEIKKRCLYILQRFYNKSSSPQLLQDLCESQISLCLGYYTHLYTLFFEVPSYFDMRVPCGFAVYRSGLVLNFLQLLSLAERVMTDTSRTTEPKWLTPILLLLDSLGKVSACTQRKYNMHLVTNRVWKWYDLVTGTWTPYSAGNNKLINEAYWNGEQSVRVTCGRRRYTITFSNMLQCNDETGNNRPVSMTLINLANESKFDLTDIESSESLEPEEVILTEKEEKRCVPAPSLSKQQTLEIVRNCVRIMHLQIDKDLLHAIMRICLRLTRDFEIAKMFVLEGGVKCLLNMRQTAAFSGYGPLATVLIRHTLEEPLTLAHSIEKVIRGRALPSIPPPYRELIYLTRQIGGALTRSPETFFEVAKSILRVDCSIFRRSEDCDSRLPLRAEPTTRTQAPQLEEDVSVQVIYDLLNSLLQPLELAHLPDAKDISYEFRPQGSVASTSSTSNEPVFQTASALFPNRPASTEEDNQDETLVTPPMIKVRLIKTSNEALPDNKPEHELHKKPLLAKHSILKILADVVVSYGAVAKLITDYVYDKHNSNNIILEECTALAFMFDKLLPVTENISDRDCSMMCRVLIAAISSCNHCPDAQSSLVNEVKAALMRALLMPESFEKHTRIQLITGIITTMIENCPPSNQLRVFKNQPVNGQINNIVKLMLRKGIFNDLARITHYLDLSSPNFPITVNSSLKPMESLSRIVNQPVSGVSNNKAHKKSQQNNLDDAGGTTQSGGTTSTEATNAQGEEVIEDPENTDHDVSVVGSSIEANSEVRTRHDETASVLEQIMDQLLDHHGTSETTRSYSEVASGRNHATMDIDDSNLGYEHEPDATEELMSTDSGDSDSNASDQDVEDDDNEVDDDDIDEADDNDDNNFEDEVHNEVLRLASSLDREEDVLMIQYADHELDETLPRMVRWNENEFAVPLFDDFAFSTPDQSAPANHPLLLSRHNTENTSGVATRMQRTNRARRYQYLQLNPRNNSNPPVILQRLLGPVAQNLSMSTTEIMSTSGGRDTARVMIMDNFGLIPTNEEQIDFVDQSGYLFGPSLAATLNHVPSVLHWWNEESKLLDIESTYDTTIYICNKLIPTLIYYRNRELCDRKRKKEEEELRIAKIKLRLCQEAMKKDDDIAFYLMTPLHKNDGSESNSSEDIAQESAPQTADEDTCDIEAGVRRSLEAGMGRPVPSGYSSPDVHFARIDWGELSDCGELNDSVIPEANRPSVIQRALREHDNSNLEPFDDSAEENIGEPQVNSSVSRQSLNINMSEVTRSEGATRDIQSPENYNYDPYSELLDDQNSTDENLSEVERVASVGISERRLLDNTIASSEIEPFEEPSDITFDSFMELPPLCPMPTMPPDPEVVAYNYSLTELPPLTTPTGEIIRSGIPIRRDEGYFLRLEQARLRPLGITDFHPPFTFRQGHPTFSFPHSHQIRHSCPVHQQIPSNDDVPFLPAAPVSHPLSQVQPPVPPPMPSISSQTHSVIGPSTSQSCQSNSHEEEEDDFENLHDSSSNRDDDTSGDQSDTSSVIPIQVLNVNPSRSEASTETSDTFNSLPVDVIMNDGGGSNTSEDIPEGVDPSFLEALPPEMRREVLEEYRLINAQRNQTTNSSGTGDEAESVIPSEVSPEFLAALPPALQEEVLTHQRLEQQRQAVSHTNPDEPVDASAFFETLQPSLRTMILADMEDSQMSALPPDLAAEAQTLRRDWEARNRQLVQERFLQSNLTTIIRQSTRGGGRMSSRVNSHHALPQRAHWGTWGQAEVIQGTSGSSTSVRMRGRQLLDHESLSCLLVLLFTDDPKLNTLRLHRVIRNLCYHGPTRDWIIKALLSIIDRSIYTKTDDSLTKPLRQRPKPGPLTSKLLTDSKHIGNGATWLNIRMEAALGCHANVFVVNRTLGKRTDRTNLCNIIIHPQAAPIVCKNTLDLFISLSKNFPSYLLPLKMKDDKEDKNKSVTSPSKTKVETTDFWEMLLKLDSTSSKKGKSLAKAHSSSSLTSEIDNTNTSFEQSAFGQLLCTLSSPIIYRSTQLTDKLLRLLAVITAGMPELGKSGGSSKSHKSKLPKYESVSAPESALSLAVNVLTYKSCSEDGLEDATNLLLNLSNCSMEMSYMILSLLLHGAIRIGEVVREQIQSMLDELQKFNKVQKRKVQDDVNHPSTSKGTMSNRFTKETVVITASTKIKASYDLQLPSMAPLTSKVSSQLFLLRILRVIVQIREAIKKGLPYDKKSDESELSTDAGEDMGETSALQNSQLIALSDQLSKLDNLWDTLSFCLLELEHTPDDHAVLVLQPAVEAFFLVHSPQEPLGDDKEANKTSNIDQDFESASQCSSQGLSQVLLDSEICSNCEGNSKSNISPDQLKFLNFAEKHRTVLNQILRQSTAHLSDGPFSVLVDHTKVLDFDVKRKYFRTELERLDQGLRREETAIHVRRSNVFEDSFRELYRRTPEEWKNRFYIVFEEEEGQDAGGLLREWYMIISRDIFNPMYALFTTSPGDRVTYMINPASHYNPNHLCYYKFVGRVIAKAIYDNKLLECYFTRSFYKHILGIPVKYTDMESEDYSFYRGLVYLMENNIKDLDYDLTFSTEINEFGVTETRDLIINGRNVPVSEENKMEYVRLSCQMKMTGAIRQQLTAFLDGFYDIIPKRLISIFNEQELELLISGLPNVDIEDLKANTEYHKYQCNSLQIQWFWRALRSFDQADRAKFLQFVTGTSKVPLQGFAHLEGMNGVQKFQIHRDDRSTDRLPSAHTCFNQLDLPVYETSDKLRTYLLKAIHECSEGFGFA